MELSERIGGARHGKLQAGMRRAQRCGTKHAPGSSCPRKQKMVRNCRRGDLRDALVPSKRGLRGEELGREEKKGLMNIAKAGRHRNERLKERLLD